MMTLKRPADISPGAWAILAQGVTSDAKMNAIVATWRTNHAVPKATAAPSSMHYSPVPVIDRRTAFFASPLAAKMGAHDPNRPAVSYDPVACVQTFTGKPLERRGGPGDSLRKMLTGAGE